ncbi:MAG: hypothetical protein WC370_10905 [Dehalococcoidales bacterium]|jgi:hypothetical protein
MPYHHTSNQDPDEGLEIKENIVNILKDNRRTRKPRIPMEQILKKHNIKLNGAK